MINLLPSPVVYLGYLLSFLLAALACFGSAYHARRISDPDTRYGLMGLLLTSGGWAAAHVGYLLFDAQGVKAGFYLTGLIIGFGTVWAWLWFCSAYTGRSLHRNPTVQRLSLLVFGAVTITKLLPPLQPYYFTVSKAVAPFPHVAVDHHLLYWVSMGLAYALAVIGYFMLAEFFGQIRVGGRILGGLMGVMALPFVFNIVGYAGPWLLDISHEPIGVAIFAIGVLFLFRGRFERAQRAGRQEDPAIVVGADGKIRDYNLEAADLLPALRSQPVVGTPLHSAVPELADVLGNETPILEVEGASHARYYQVTETPFGTGKGAHSRLLALTDVTARELHRRALEKETGALRSMSRITAGREISFERKARRLLDLGREYLGLAYGYLARIEGEEQEVVAGSGDHRLLDPGTRTSLSEAYYRESIHERRVQGLRNAREEGWATDPAYERFGFDTCIWARIDVGGALYGVFCFGDSATREAPFTEREHVFMELLARWASYEIERHRARERLEQKNQRLDRFASVLSHDLRNPLNVAKGRLQLIEEEGDVPPSVRQHFGALGRALDRMSGIMDDVLTLTWGGQAVESKDLESCSLAEVAEASWEQVETIEAELRLEHPPVVRAEKRRLGRLLENLFRNAIEHGGDRVTVWVGGHPKGFYVEDDGPGVPEDEWESIFEAGHSSREQGTGLGLSIVRSIAETHGWDVSVKKGREGGARFVFAGVEIRDASPGETDPLTA